MIIPSPAASCTTGHVLMARSPAWLFPGCHPDPVALSASHPLQQIWSSPTEWYSEPRRSHAAVCVHDLLSAHESDIVATFMIWVATFAMASIVVLGVAFGFVGFSAGEYVDMCSLPRDPCCSLADLDSMKRSRCCCIPVIHVQRLCPLGRHSLDHGEYHHAGGRAAVGLRRGQCVCYACGSRFMGLSTRYLMQMRMDSPTFLCLSLRTDMGGKERKSMEDQSCEVPVVPASRELCRRLHEPHRVST
ncbi:hypothetical protein EV126DRAFT_427228 [Verticillium dahliae]|nr:hypothetical protein EV126DRAFT_427228 [Verticillium dahliae]